MRAVLAAVAGVAIVTLFVIRGDADAPTLPGPRTGLVPPPLVIDCARRVEGPPGWPHSGWKRDAVKVGPVLLYGLRNYARRGEGRLPGGAITAETVALVPAGRQVTLAVSPRRRESASMFWETAPDAGRKAVTLQACDAHQRLFGRHGRVGGRTQFNGGIGVERAGCVGLDVWTTGRSVPHHAEVSFGRGRDGCPARRPQGAPPADRTTGLVPPPLVVGCLERVEVGGRWPPRGWRRHSVVAGPLALFDLRAHEGHPEEFDRAVGASLEMVALVRAGRQATLSVPPDARRRLSLLFGRGYAGVPAVTFRACPPWERRFRGGRRVGKWTLFQGGLGVRGAQCAVLDVWLRHGSRPLRRRVGFGRRCA